MFYVYSTKGTTNLHSVVQPSLYKDKYISLIPCLGMRTPLCNPLLISSTVLHGYDPSGNNTVFIWKETYTAIRYIKDRCN